MDFPALMCFSGSNTIDVPTIWSSNISYPNGPISNYYHKPVFFFLYLPISKCNHHPYKYFFHILKILSFLSLSLIIYSPPTCSVSVILYMCISLIHILNLLCHLPTTTHNHLSPWLLWNLICCTLFTLIHFHST